MINIIDVLLPLAHANALFIDLDCVSLLESQHVLKVVPKMAHEAVKYSLQSVVSNQLKNARFSFIAF